MVVLSTGQGEIVDTFASEGEALVAAAMLGLKDFRIETL